jgi:hypothetical protein
VLTKPRGDVGLELMEDDTIKVNGQNHGINYDYLISSVNQIEDYLFLLTFILHSHRFNTPNTTTFFQKLKYINMNL